MWLAEQEIPLHSESAGLAQFGVSVSLTRDLLAVSAAPGSSQQEGGQVWVFQRNASAALPWHLLCSLKVAGRKGWGGSVSLEPSWLRDSAEARLAVSAPGSNMVDVFRLLPRRAECQHLLAATGRYMAAHDLTGHRVALWNEVLAFNAPGTSNERFAPATSGRLYLRTLCATNRFMELGLCRHCSAGTFSPGGVATACQPCPARPPRTVWAGPGRGCEVVCEPAYFGATCLPCSQHRAQLGQSPPTGAHWADGLPACEWRCDSGWTRDDAAQHCVPPPPPAALPAPAVRSTTASTIALEWAAADESVPGAAVRAYVVQWWVDSENSSSSSVGGNIHIDSAEFAGTQTSGTLRQLRASTMFRLRVAARNDGGLGAWSTPYPAATTLITAPPSPPGVAALVAATGSSLTLAWEPPADHGGDPDLLYTVQLFVAGTGSGGGDMGRMVAQANSSSTSALLRGLSAHTLHRAIVTSRNAAGASPPSALSAALQTGPPTPPAAPGVPTLQHAAGGALVLRWQRPQDLGGLPLLRYELQMAHGAAAANSTFPPPSLCALLPANGSARAQELAVGDLPAASAFRFRVAAVSAAGRGEASLPSALLFTSNATAPAPPEVGKVAAGASTLQVALLPAADTGGAALLALRVQAVDAHDRVAAEVEVGAEEEAEAAEAEETEAAEAALLHSTANQTADSAACVCSACRPVALLNATLRGLRALSPYRLRTAALNDQGWGAWSGLYGPFVTAPAQPPGAPAPPRLVSRTGSQLTVEWDPPADLGGAPLLAHQLRLASASLAPLRTLDVGPGRNATVTLLDAQTAYTLRVSAWSAAGRGLFSDWSLPLHTAPAAPPAAPGVEMAEGTTGSAAWLRVQPAVEDGGVPLLRVRAQVLPESAGEAAAWEEAAWEAAAEHVWPWSVARGGTQVVRVTGLLAHTAYRARVTVSNAEGESQFSAMHVVFATGPPAPPSAPSHVRAALPGSSSVRLSWQLPDEMGGAVALGHLAWPCIVTLQHAAAVTQRCLSAVSVTDVACDGTLCAGMAAGLAGSTSFRFHLATRNTAGVGGNSSLTDIITTLPPTPPSAPRQVHAEAASSGTVRVEWLPPADAGGSPVHSYLLLDVLAGEPPKVVTAQAACTGGACGTLLHGLRPGTAHAFLVTAMSRAGASILSAPSAPVLTPRAAPPAAPPVPLVLSVTHDAAVLEWARPSAHAGCAALVEPQVWLARCDAGAAQGGQCVGATGSAVLARNDQLRAVADVAAGLLRVTGLRANVTLAFAVALRGLGGVGQRSAFSPPARTLPPLPPTAPRQLQAAVLNASSMRLVWLPPHAVGGAAEIMYEAVLWWTADGNATMVLACAADSASEGDAAAAAAGCLGPLRVQLGSLPRATLALPDAAEATDAAAFAVRVRAVTAAGKGPFCDATAVPSLAAGPRAPPPPRDVRVAAEGAGFLRLTWSVPGLPESTESAGAGAGGVAGGVAAKMAVAAAPVVLVDAAEAHVFVVRVRTLLDSSAPVTAAAEHTITVPGSESSATVSGLAANATYAVCVSAASDAGEGEDSGDVLAATQPAVPPAPAPWVTVVAVSGSAVLVQWAAPPVDAGAPLTAFRVCVWAASNNASACDAEAVVPPTARNATLLGLTAHTRYGASVAALNDAGWGDTAEAGEQVVTPGPHSPSPPGTPQLLSVLSSSAAVAWAAPEDAGGAAIANYSLQWQEVGAQGAVAPWQTTEAPAQPQLAVLRGLRANTTFLLRVAATSAAGLSSAPSASISFVTLPATVPDRPAALHVLNVTASTATLAWEAPADDGGAAVEAMELRYSAAGHPLSAPLLLPANATQAVLRHLTADTQYLLALAARNAAGLGAAATNSELLTLAPHAPAPPPAPLLAAAGSSSLLLAPRPPTDFGGLPLTRFRAQLAWAGAGGAGGMEEREGPLPSPVAPARPAAVPPLQLAGLRGNTTYAVRLALGSEAGMSAWGAALQGASTLPPVPPAPPAALVASSAAVGRVSLAWAPPADDGGAPVQRYLVLHGASAQQLAALSVGWRLQPHVAALNTTHAEVRQLPTQATHYFAVAAVNEAGQGAASAAVAVHLSAAPQPPTAVRNASVVAVAGDAVTLGWAPPRDTGGAALQRYVVQARLMAVMLDACEALGDNATAPAWSGLAGSEPATSTARLLALLQLLALPREAVEPCTAFGGVWPCAQVTEAVPAGEGAGAGEAEAAGGAVVRGLAPAALYELSVHAESAALSGPAVHVAIVRTATAPPTAVQLGPAVAAVTATGAVLSWRQPQAPGGCPNLHYLVALWRAGAEGAEAALATLPDGPELPLPSPLLPLQPAVAARTQGAGGATVVTYVTAAAHFEVPLQDLVRVTPYVAAVAAASSAGRTWSAPVTFSTSPAPPAAPREVVILSITAVGCTLEWQPPADDGGAAPLLYRAHLQQLGSGQLVQEEVTDALAVQLTRLPPDTLGCAQVRSETPVGASPWSGWECFRSLPPLPCPAQCSGHGVCHAYDGTCQCERGFQGANCTQAAGALVHLRLQGEAEAVEAAALEQQLAALLNVTAARVAVVSVLRGSVLVDAVLLREAASGEPALPQLLVALLALARSRDPALLRLAITHVAVQEREGGPIVTVDIAPANCSRHLFCGTCVADPACGYCASGNGTCVEGGAAGPAPGRGTCSDWRHADSSAGAGVCPIECGLRASCQTCVQDTSCHWCPYFQRCEANTTRRGCPADSPWFAGPAEHCPHTATCAALSSSCQACTQQQGCGWCAGLLPDHPPRCLPGDRFGSALCPRQHWRYGRCTGPQCAALSSCDDCTAQPPCQWCRDRARCGDPAARDDQQCGEWRDGAELECGPPPPQCSALRECGACRAEPHCQWCPTCMDAQLDGTQACPAPPPRCIVSCGRQLITARSGIVSLGQAVPVPVYYAAGSTCEWLITPVTGDGLQDPDSRRLPVVRATFTRVQLGVGDVLEVFNGPDLTRDRVAVLRGQLQQGARARVEVDTGYLRLRLTATSTAGGLGACCSKRRRPPPLQLMCTAVAIAAAVAAPRSCAHAAGFAMMYSATTRDPLYAFALILVAILIACLAGVCCCVRCLMARSERHQLRALELVEVRAAPALAPPPPPRAHRSSPGTRAAQLQRLASRGADDEVLAALPDFTWTAALAEKARDATCCICLAEFEAEQQLKRLPCRHEFHSACIVDWLRVCARARRYVLRVR